MPVHQDQKEWLSQVILNQLGFQPCQDMGDDRHIENHVSKNCHVTSCDVLMHLNRAHQAMGEVS